MNQRAFFQTVNLRWRLVWSLTLAFVTAMLALSNAAVAQEQRRPTVEAIRVGFGESKTNSSLGDSMSKYKAGCWTPVELTFQGGTDSITGSVEIHVADADGATCVMVHPRPVQLMPGKRTKVQMYAKFGAPQPDVQIIFRDERRKAIINRPVSGNNASSDTLSIPWPIQPGERLVLSIGPSLGVEQAAVLHQTSGGEAISVAQIDDVAILPTEWYGYDGVDTVVITTSSPEMFTKLLDTGARVAALERWIEQGGKLVLAVGSQAPAVLAPDAVLARFAPGRFVEPTTLKRTVALENYVGGGRKVPRPQGRDLALPVPKLESVEGVTVIAEADLPLVVKTPRRFGQITFVAVDLDRQPFIDWDGRGLMASRLLGLPDPSTSTDPNNINNMGNRRWMQDLAGQMQSGLDQFAGVTRIPFALVALLILGYIALIGPGDYFLVKRVLKRMELTWVTFPLWVILVSGGAYLLAVYTKGDDLRLNQVDLIDVDVATGQTRGTTWLNLFTPQSRAFDLSLIPKQPSGAEVPQSDRLFAWSGAANRPYGGGGGGMFSGEYTFTPQLDAVKGAPIQVWSTKGFLGRSSYSSTPTVTADLTMDTSRVPAGEIRNGLDEVLVDCLLLSDRWAFSLGAIKAGETITLKPGERRDLEQVLRNPTGFVDSPTNYQPNYYNGVGGGDVMQTLHAMMFFKGAGGSTRNLTNSMEQYLDMTDLLSLDRAVLVGRATRSAAQLAADGEPLTVPAELHWVVYRFVFPIKPAAKAERE
ncbi:MAG TPA: hypothetical protein VGJ26_00685 [Pirellulales bacterium]|jgi:hypothetical protein